MNIIDNKTAHNSKEYDRNIYKTIQYYELFYKETIDLVQSYKNDCEIWLDTGCGTGNFVEIANNIFKNTKFILSDCNDNMINIAKNKLKNFSDRIEFISGCSSENLKNTINRCVDVVTAIQVHHYLNRQRREEATKNCYEILKKGGIYITFEKIKPLSDKGIEIGLNRWAECQLNSGRSKEIVENHKKRFDKAYYPITILDHIALLRKAGFKYCEVFFVSQMQAGFYAIK